MKLTIMTLFAWSLVNIILPFEKEAHAISLPSEVKLDKRNNLTLPFGMGLADGRVTYKVKEYFDLTNDTLYVIIPSANSYLKPELGKKTTPRRNTSGLCSKAIKIQATHGIDGQTFGPEIYACLSPFISPSLGNSLLKLTPKDKAELGVKNSVRNLEKHTNTLLASEREARNSTEKQLQKLLEYTRNRQAENTRRINQLEKNNVKLLKKINQLLNQ